MSGHSKWSQIKRKKAKTDQARGKVFSKLVREITTAARTGGDPKMNMRLKTAIEEAKAVNMPADTLKRAIQKGTGELPGETYDEITYEGYGPGGVAVMVKTLTDNKNRTAPEIRHTFTKFSGNLGEVGSVGWMFDRKGIIQVEAARVDEDELLGLALDAGAADLRRADSVFEITATPQAIGLCRIERYTALRDVLTRHGRNLWQRTRRAMRGEISVSGRNIEEFWALKDVSFEGSGCAISKASASMMTQAVKGKNKQKVEELFKGFHSMVTGEDEPAEDELGNLRIFEGVREFPVRVKCATLPWHTLHAALNKEELVSTE
jgi:SUF system NifU family Fe-S assembly protein